MTSLTEEHELQNIVADIDNQQYDIMAIRLALNSRIGTLQGRPPSPPPAPAVVVQPASDPTPPPSRAKETSGTVGGTYSKL